MRGDKVTQKTASTRQLKLGKNFSRFLEGGQINLGKNFPRFLEGRQINLGKNFPRFIEGGLH
jgi:hypothetical protein